MATLEERVTAVENALAAITTPTHAEVVEEVMDVVARWRTRENEFRAWQAGPADGGPNGDGRYPMTDPEGNTNLTPSLSRIAADASKMVPQTLTGANAFTLNAGHSGKLLIVFNTNSAITLTLPGNADVGWNALFYQLGPGRLVFAINNGGTIRNDQTFDRTRGQYSLATAICVGKDSGGKSTIVIGGSLANS